MAKKAIGIDIGRSYLRAVQMVRTTDGFRIEKLFGIQMRRRTDSPINVLRALTTQHGFDRHAEVAVCLPHHAIFFADTKIDSDTLRALHAGDTSALKDDFPIRADKALVQVCSTRSLGGDQHAALVAATSSDLLDEELSLLGEGRLQPTLIETPITAAHMSVAFNHPECQRQTALILCVEDTTLSLAVIHDGRLLTVRHIPIQVPQDGEIETAARQITDILGREIEITWHKLFDADPDADLRVFLVAESKTGRYLAAAIEGHIDCRVTVVDPYAKIERGEDTQAQFPICVAEGLALRRLMPPSADSINFVAAQDSQANTSINFRKELAVCGTLLAVIVVVWIVGLFAQLSRLESRYAGLKSQIVDLTRKTLPQEKHIVDARAQLQQKLAAFRENSAMLTALRPGHLTPLGVLRLLSLHRPGGNTLMFDDLLITSDSVRITGTCDSFRTLLEWQQELEKIPEFDIVDVQDPEKNAKTGKVNFTLSLSSGKTVRR
jgi:Tfp pilus assembly PilM family ATPase